MGEEDDCSSLLPDLPSTFLPEKIAALDIPQRQPMARPDIGVGGKPIKLCSNHFNLKLSDLDATFYQYSVSIKSVGSHTVEGKGINRKVMDKLYQTYGTELATKDFAYDGEKNLFTVGALPQNNFEFMVTVEKISQRSSTRSTEHGNLSEGDHKRSKRTGATDVFKVEISFATKIPLKSIGLALKGNESENSQDALRVLDIILRQQQAKRGCLLIGQSFFSCDIRNFTDLGGGVTACRGFHSSFRTTQGGVSLNMDISTTMIVTPGPVETFLLQNQNVRDPRQIDWIKAKKTLKNLRVKTKHNNMEFKINGLSNMPCNQQLFQLKVRNGGAEETEQVTVYDYFLKSHQIELGWSAYAPCLDVGKSKRPNYLPIELCHLVPLQRYTKALSSQQRILLVEKSGQKSHERMKMLAAAVENNNYDEDRMLSSCGISIDKFLTKVDGRVLDAPRLRVGNSEYHIPCDGRWTFKNKRLLQPTRIDRWAIVNFSARCDLSYLSRELINCGRNKGIHIEGPYTLIEEEHHCIKEEPVTRVERMFEQIMAKLPGLPQFLLCVLPERKSSPIYGPWKRKNLHELGIVTQCLSPIRISDHYLTNLLLKINSKLGGINSVLAVELEPSVPYIKDEPTMIIGMDVSHGSPGQSGFPSVAAVVGSRSWPLISRYRASVRTQSPKVEMIDSLCKILPNGEDDGIIRELLLDFYQTSQSRKPSQIIIFRDGVSESQFNQVLNIELDQILKAYLNLGESKAPKFTFIVAQKNHRTKLFQTNRPENVPPGTVVDTKVVHPRNYDFFIYSHAGIIGTSRPAHYHVLLDEIGFTVTDLQQLVHSLCYVNQRSTSATSIVAPICYAHLAAQQMLHFIKPEDLPETYSSGQGEDTSVDIPELPRLHKNVCCSMFFC